MRSNPIGACVLIALTALLPAAARSEGAQTPHEYCGTNIPPDEALGFVPLPEGDVFCPLIADPKASYSFLSYLRGTSSSALGTDLASVGVGDRFGLVRWGGPQPGEGLQFSLEGSVFAQFDLNTPSYDLLNADYLIGAPVTFRRGPMSARLRVYHQSSHLGDEFVLRGGLPHENLSFESVEGILSADVGPLRLYGGGEDIFTGTPRDVRTWLVHGGAELRQRKGGLRLGEVTIRFVAAGDVKAVEAVNWKPGWSARAGLEFNRTRETLHASRRWDLLGQFYDGPSPYGQFFPTNVRYYGLGLHFAL